MYSLNTLTSYNSQDFLNKIIKRGNIIDKHKKELLIDFEKKYREHGDKIDLEELLDNKQFTKSEQELIKLFKKFNPNINYITYILIISSLDVQNIKNLNRFIIINWNRTKISFQNSPQYNYIRSINFSEISTLENINNKEEIIDTFISLIIKFVKQEKIDNNVNFSMHMIFIINSFQNYFCP